MKIVLQFCRKLILSNNITFRDQTTTASTTTGTTTQGVTTSGTTPDNWIPGCPCNGMEDQELGMCMMEQGELDPNPCYSPPGMNSSIFRSKSCYQ